MDEKTDFEKVVEGVNQLVSALAEYYKALVDKGFDKNQAFLLTQSYQQQLLSLFKKNKDSS